MDVTRMKKYTVCSIQVLANTIDYKTYLHDVCKLVSQFVWMQRTWIQRVSHSHTLCPRVAARRHGSVHGQHTEAGLIRHLTALQHCWFMRINACVKFVLTKTCTLTNLKFDFRIFAGDRGLEVCGYGGGSYVPVDLCDSVCGGHPGLIPSASLSESDYSQPAAQLRNPPHMMSKEENRASLVFFLLAIKLLGWADADQQQLQSLFGDHLKPVVPYWWGQKAQTATLSVPNLTNKAPDRVKPDKKSLAATHCVRQWNKQDLCLRQNMDKMSPHNQNHVVYSNTTNILRKWYICKGPNVASLHWGHFPSCLQRTAAELDWMWLSLHWSMPNCCRNIPSYIWAMRHLSAASCCLTPYLCLSYITMSLRCDVWLKNKYSR